MLFLLSPAKSLDFEPPDRDLPHSLPLYPQESAELVAILREKSPRQLAQLMDLSDALAELNAARYVAWRPKFTAKNAKQSVLAFNGDVYEGLDAKSLKAEELEWAQDHLCILSGLYGVLRPLDWMQAYRLEMGTTLANQRGANLYKFWGSKIADYLNQRQKDEKSPVVVNLASQEYFKSVDRKALQAQVVECVFQENKNGQYKVISFMAKRARGLMARFAIQRRLTKVAQLTRFNSEGYAHDAAASTPDRLVFRRDAKPQ